MKLLVTGATGKVGQNFLATFYRSGYSGRADVVALCNNRIIEPSERLTVVQGSIADRDVVAEAMSGVTHVLHLAAVKESPDSAIDVAVKGMFLLLEAFRASPVARRFILTSGDCAVGHIFQPYEAPVTETSPRRAYKGCYALTKVIEEVMLEQYQVQYDIDGVILRAPWIMEKDDFRFAMTFGPDQFGGPPWGELMDNAALAECEVGGRAPLMRDCGGRPLKRNFVHVDDLVDAIIVALDHPAAAQQLFNIAMDEPVDYGRATKILEARYGLRPIEIPTPFHGNWLDNAKARSALGWAPKVGLEAMIERAWSYKRAADEARRIWYPG